MTNNYLPINRVSAPILPDTSGNTKPFDEVEGIKLYNTSTVGTLRHELILKDEDYSLERNRIFKGLCSDGIKPMTKEELDEERALSWVLVKKFTMKVFSMDMTRFSFPVGYSEPRSFLERMADLFSFLATNYIDKAMGCDSIENKLLNITIGVIAGFQLYMQTKKPWNPVLGETYCGKWPNGVSLFCEQISHHPPISAFQIIGPNNAWKCSATCTFKILSGIFEFDVVQGGTFTLEINNEETESSNKCDLKYEWEFPTIAVLGILKGDRIVRVQGPIIVKDVTNKIQSYIEIWPKNDKKRGISNTRASTLYGGIFDYNENENNNNGDNNNGGSSGGGLFSSFMSSAPQSPLVTKTLKITIKGDYADRIDANGEEVFDIKKDFALRPIADVDESDLLLSDSRFRLDRALLIEGKMDAADQAKNAIEEMQRREEKLRI